MAERFDLIIIGAGPGGYVAAIRAAQLGMQVACIEKRPTLGGTCLNVGCIPSKALLDSSELYAQTRSHLGHHGIQIGSIQLDLGAMMTRKDKIVSGLTGGIKGLFRKNKITSIQGSGKLLAPGQVRVTETSSEGQEGAVRILEAKAIILATGSEPTGIPTLPFDGTNIVSSTEAIAFDKVPQHLIIIGAGYIGLELGSVWSRLGSKVTVLEFLPRILPFLDYEIADLLYRSLQKQGLIFHLETKVLKASTQGGEVLVNAQQKDKDVLFQGDKVLVSVGRRANTKGLGLSELGVQTDPRTGQIPVNENFQSNIPTIYAIGDLIAGPMLAHKAEEDGVACVERLAGMKTHVNYLTVPSVIYTWPEVASVGLTEDQIKAEGKAYSVGKFPFMASARARCMDESEGLVKVLADKATDRLLGVHIFGPRASELISEAVTVMEFGGSAEDIARVCHAHPTLSESVREAALAALGRPINY